MTVSIIIAVKTWQENLENCVAKCLALDYPRGVEIIIAADDPIVRDFPSAPYPVRVVATGAVSPARKRDEAMKHATGEILAFIDDDAYPAPRWLGEAVGYFGDQTVAAVGGPAVTPDEDSLRQKAGGAVYAAWIVSGPYRHRYVPLARRDVQDLPSCNLLVRASVMKKIGGFRTDYWPGEDTKFCLDIVKLGLRIVYAPEVLVYHHRRALFGAHLKQIAAYALHRGYFARKYPQTSRRPAYFLPSLLVVSAAFGAAVCVFAPAFRPVYAAAGSVYVAAVLASSLTLSPVLLCCTFFGIIMTHITYGIFLLKGLFLGVNKEPGA